MTKLSHFLATNKIRLNKKLGQNFLKDESVLETIVTAAKITPDDHIVEIGPGIGVLTAKLIEVARHVTAIEMDENLIPLLNKFIALETPPENSTGKLQLINANALHTPLPNTPYKIVANIPYHIISPLLRHAFLESAVTPTSLTLLIQKEVAQKICDTKNGSLLSILVSLFGTPHIVTTVSAKAFIPPPKVESAVLHIESFAKPIACTETIEEIFTLTKLAFSQKRKMLRGTIGKSENGMERMQSANIDPTRRPQTLSIDEWIKLAKA